MSEDDARFMRRAIELARPRLGQTGDNPAVGCVLVKHGEVLAEAATADGGRPHAEEQALEIAGEISRGATAYVTLEPCGARTSGAASCAERLAAAGIGRVVVACDDPSPLASGRGAVKLTHAGVDVVIGVLEREASSLYVDYFARVSVASRKDDA
jgi:diaminohydroxyphosphoribosylaminopyrimidine deaminase/5-amino-6-(5-phosphoribosylamino)uracil reductase